MSIDDIDGRRREEAQYPPAFHNVLHALTAKEGEERTEALRNLNQYELDLLASYLGKRAAKNPKLARAMYEALPDGPSRARIEELLALPDEELAVALRPPMNRAERRKRRR